MHIETHTPATDDRMPIRSDARTELARTAAELARHAEDLDFGSYDTVMMADALREIALDTDWLARLVERDDDGVPVSSWVAKNFTPMRSTRRWCLVFFAGEYVRKASGIMAGLGGRHPDDAWRLIEPTSDLMSRIMDDDIAPLERAAPIPFLTLMDRTEQFAGAL